MTRKEELERQTDEYLSAISIDEDFKDLTLRYLGEVHQQEVKDSASIQKSLHSAYEDTQKRSDNLTDMRLKEMIGDEEYISHRNRFLKERVKLKEKIDDTEHRADKWFELSERAFNFACYARYWFENEEPKEKNTILRAIGSNFSLEDRKLSIELKNPWLMIQKGLKRADQKKGRFEPSRTPASTGVQGSLSPKSIAWLPGQDSNLQPSG